MKKLACIGFLFLVACTTSFSQTSEETFIVYDVIIADTAQHLPITVWEYAYQRKHIENIPFEQREILLDDLFKSIIDKKYTEYWWDFTELPAGTFPVIHSDTTQIQYPFPPYDYHDTVFRKIIVKEQILSIRYYEKWILVNGLITKDILAFSFKILPTDYYGKVQLDKPAFAPLIFVRNKKDVPYLRKKLNIK